jgi:hypothetical protein
VIARPPGDRGGFEAALAAALLIGFSILELARA